MKYIYNPQNKLLTYLKLSNLKKKNSLRSRLLEKNASSFCWLEIEINDDTQRQLLFGKSMACFLQFGDPFSRGTTSNKVNNRFGDGTLYIRL